MQYEQRQCPITGRTVNFYRRTQTRGLGDRYLHEDCEIAISATGNDWLKRSKDSSAPAAISAEISAAKLLIRSRHWRAAHEGGRRLWLTTRDDLERAFNHEERSHFHIIALEDAASEAEEMSFTTKGLETLENLYAYWLKSGQLPTELNRYRAIDQGINVWREPSMQHIESGLTYCADERLAPMIYEHLEEQGFMRNRSDRDSTMHLTASAFREIDAIKRGRRQAIRRGFFVRRYDEDLDSFYHPIINEVSRQTGCDIHAVWERPKNQKLDELIMRRIRESAVVIVDVTGDRFNVGLELGYALALRKQVVVVCEDDNKRELPFDIRTVNCYFYSRERAADLQQKLIERVHDGLEEARLGTLSTT